MKLLTPCALELLSLSVMKMGRTLACSAGAPLDTAGVRPRMEPSGLGLELEGNPNVTTKKVCSCLECQFSDPDYDYLPQYLELSTNFIGTSVYLSVSSFIAMFFALNQSNVYSTMSNCN